LCGLDASLHPIVKEASRLWAIYAYAASTHRAQAQTSSSGPAKLVPAEFGLGLMWLKMAPAYSRELIRPLDLLTIGCLTSLVADPTSNCWIPLWRAVRG